MTLTDRYSPASPGSPSGTAPAADAPKDDIASKGAAALREAKANVEDMISDAGDYAGQKGREAMDNVAHAEADHIEAPLAKLDETERTEALGLAVMIVGYVIVDACGTQWPDDANVRQFAESVATGGTTARRLQLDAGQIYAYLSRVVLGAGSIEDVIPDEPMFTRIPVIVAQRAIVGFSPKEMGIWDYLDQIESAIEVAWALDTTVLPATVMRAYLPKPESSG